MTNFANETKRLAVTDITMNKFVNAGYSMNHAGAARLESAAAMLNAIFKSASEYSSIKGVLVMLLVSLFLAFMVISGQLVDTHEDGDLLAIWVIFCSFVFAAAALMSNSIVKAYWAVLRRFNEWGRARIQARNDDRMWEAALRDPRLMADITAAITRGQKD